MKNNHKIIFIYELKYSIRFTIQQVLFILTLMIQINNGFTQPILPASVFNFQGRSLLVLSDADMLSSAYFDGKLGPVAGTDALSVINLDRPIQKLQPIPISVSNSVTGPPAGLDVTPDGRYAIIGERLGPRPTNNKSGLFKDLPIGKKLSVVDLTDRDKPKINQIIDGPELANSVSINFDGSLVAVSFYSADSSQTSLVVYRFAKGRLTDPAYLNIPGWAAGDVIRDATFHPKENIITILNFTKSQVSFIKINGEDSKISALPWGNIVGVEKAPFLARFTPNGNYVVVNASYGAGDVLGSGWGAPRGIVSTIKVYADTSQNGILQHQLVSHAETGVNPEGMNISPDDKWVVTTNLERTAMPFDSPKQGFFSSVTLLRLDSVSGILERIGDFASDGLMPESAVFDNSSRFIATTAFEHADDNLQKGSINFWRIAGDFYDPKRIELVKLNHSVPVTRGAHTMVIVRK